MTAPARLAPDPSPSGGPRVAVVVSRFPALTETFILRELIELERQGLQIELVPLLRGDKTVVHPEAEPWIGRAHYTPFLDARIVWVNLKLLVLAPRRYLGTLLALLWAARSSLNALVGTLGIFPKSVRNGQLLRELGTSHVHAHFATHPAASAYIMKHVHSARQRALPYSVTMHAHDVFVTAAGLERKLGDAAFVRSISRFNVDYLMRRCPGVFPDLLFRVIHCGIEPRRYTHRPEPGRPGVDRGVRLLSIASLRPYKGIAHLIEAVRLLAEGGLELRCDVIGEGILRAELQQRIDAAGLGERFRLLGARSQREVAEALASCDVFVLPSVVAADGQMEGIPVVLMESLAASVPSIATRISGIPELVIDGETGLLVDPEQPEQIAAAVRRVLADPEAAREWAKRGRARVEREFSIGENVRRLIHAITGIW